MKHLTQAYYLVKPLYLWRGADSRERLVGIVLYKCVNLGMICNDIVAYVKQLV